MLWIKERLLWIGVAVVFTVLVLFGLAMMGSSLGAKPNDLPVAFVSMDESAERADGMELAVGEMVGEQVLANDQLPIKWEVLDSEGEAREGMEQQKYYGALILPDDLSENVLTIPTAEPQQGNVQILVNEGMNMQAATAVSQMLQQVMTGVNREISNMVLGQMTQMSEDIPVQTADALRQPFSIEEVVLHPIGNNQGQGNAPNILTQIIWITSLVTSAIMFIISRKHITEGSRGWILVLSQVTAGLMIIFIASLFLIWMATSWYGMEINETIAVWLLLWLIGSVFFLLQSSLLNWLGLPAMAILVLLFFFSMPVLGMPPEFLPQVAQDWLYSWTPLRLASASIRDMMYFGGSETISFHFTVLWTIFGVSLGLIALSPLRKTSAEKVQAEV
ncbi:YhgE/Pip domain-containing protein [Evansella halocellulosilytica]|uniref:YhgE/Pip domain-containing protein n=1 Tax=Evansella halocellulosilytica TaxID=2011013 RepID=UPI000BB8297B|nr:ABC transporter permease [Evansella halocellulosilytica]